MASGGAMSKYTKVRRLGAGSFGEAWLVECNRGEALASGASLKKGQQLVAKLVDVRGAPADELEEAKAEATLLETIVSRAVIMHVEHFMDGGDTFVIIMEYAPGGSVGDRMKPAGGKSYPLQPLPEGFAMSIACQVAEALVVLHGQGIMHRDLKPDNVLIAADGSIRVADFGVARALATTAYAKTSAGTMVFMAPEILARKKHDVKADVWSLGAMLFTMLTGRYLVASNDDIEALTAAAFGGPWAVPRGLEGVSEPIREAVAAMLTVKREDRPTAAQMLRLPAFVAARMEGLSGAATRLVLQPTPVPVAAPAPVAPKPLVSPPAGAGAPSPPELQIAPRHGGATPLPLTSKQAEAELRAICNDGSMYGDAVARAVATAAPRWVALTELNLATHRLGDSGTIIVAGALHHLRQLTKLHMSYAGMGVAGARALASALSHLPLLKTLDLGSNQHGDEGVCAIAAALPHVPQLTMLTLVSTGMGASGVRALAVALQYVPRLTWLDLFDNPAIGDPGAIALADGLHFVPQLLSLYMRHCGLTTGWFSSKPGIRALKDAVKRSCPKCTLHADEQ